jgi:hypothetical protein
VLRVSVLTRIASFSFAVSTTENLHPLRSIIEISANADTHAARIIRHEQAESSALIQEEAGARKFEPMELNPNILGDSQTTTEIVVSGEGPTTTMIYMSGEAPGPSTASPNARNLEPIYEPGAPGPPGVAGPPGPPGEPGPAAGGSTLAPLVVPVGNDATQSGYETRGDQGGVGAPGVHGYAGAAGSRGLMGDLGHRGHLGSPGPKGERGPPGKPNHANAAKTGWFICVVVINSVITLAVFVISYLEFVAGVQVSSYCRCCSRKPKSVGGAESWDEGGYEQQ